MERKAESSSTGSLSRPLHGLCLSFHHQNPSAVGSRRFRSLVSLLNSRGIELDVVSGEFGKEPEHGVVTAGSFAPFAASMKWLARMKSRIRPGGGTTDHRPSLGSADAAVLSDESRSENRSIMALLLSFENLPDSDAGWVIPAARASRRLKKKYDFVISTAPPWSSHIAAMLAGKSRGIPVILDDRDPWAGSPGRMLYMTHPWMRKLDRRLAFWCYRQAAGIVCVTEKSCQLHRDRFYSRMVPITCLPNGFDPELAAQATPPMRHDRINICYVGSLYHGRSPMLVLKPALSLPKEVAKDFHFHFVGNISQNEADALNGLDKPFGLTLHGSQSHQFCLDQISESDICLLLAIGQPSQIPAKLYEYVGLKRPVLSISDKDDATMAELQNQEWAWPCALDREEDIAAALRDIHRRWSAGALPGVDDRFAGKFNFAAIADDYAEFIRKVVPVGTETRRP